MNNVTCIIIDDEPDAALLLRMCLNDLYPELEIAGMYFNWKGAFHALKHLHVDLVFTDISMPEKSGLDLLQLLPELKTEIIFTTAHSAYALNAMRFAPAGYLLKPIMDTELTAVVTKALERVKYKRLATQYAQGTTGRKIGIFNNKGTDYVSPADIIYLESVNKCTRVITTQREYLSSYHLGKFRTMLDDTFFLVHRSFIINLAAVVRYEPGVVIMSNKRDIPVARNLRDAFFKQLNGLTHSGNHLP